MAFVFFEFAIVKRLEEQRLSKFMMPVGLFIGECSYYQDEFCGYGKKALIVTDKSSLQNGALNDVVKILNQRNIKYAIYDEVIENPPLEVVSSVAVAGIEFCSDFIIAVGGGSVIDAAKASSILIALNEKNANLLIGNTYKHHLPLLAVPTTSGSGSESTGSAILTIQEKKTKMSIPSRVFCEKAFLNPLYTYGMPEHITLSTAIDTFTHLAEGYLSKDATIYTDNLIIYGLKLFSEIIQNLRFKIFDEAFRIKVSEISSIAGIVIANTRTSLPHLMSYPLTYDKKVKHGFACALLTCEFLNFYQDKTKVSFLVKASGFESVNELQKFISIICPRIICTENEIRQYAEIVYCDKPRLAYLPFELGIEDIYSIYNSSLLKNSLLNTKT